MEGLQFIFKAYGWVHGSSKGGGPRSPERPLGPQAGGPRQGPRSLLPLGQATLPAGRTDTQTEMQTTDRWPSCGQEATDAGGAGTGVELGLHGAQEGGVSRRLRLASSLVISSP